MAKSEYVLKTYKDRKGEWRWKLIAPNGRCVCCSGEGFKNRKRAQDYAIKLLTNGVTVRLKQVELAAAV